MCGIAGILNFGGRGIDHGILKSMIKILRHRGPDELGCYSDHIAGLAHARLSIIDLSGGQQPMHNGDKTIWIAFNGEIFNYKELREELVRKGHTFRTQSDTEVILHSYEEMGEDCVRAFNGQWAFAIWDTNEEKLFLSRDRLGVRPLFYTTTGNDFLFSSEIKAIFAHPSVTRDIDLRALDQIFTFWVTLPPRTAFAGIAELPPAHCLRLKEGTLKVWRYWDVPQGEIDEALSEEDCSEQLLALLTDATRIRLRSDVPVGCYLSGGLDSTIVTALAAKLADVPVKTFSISFENREFDESIFQREASDFLQTDHVSIRCSASDVGDIFPKVIWHAEKPILRSAPAPLYLLSRLVHEDGYKVVMTGEGSDEILGGYDIFKETKIRSFWGHNRESKIRPLLLKRLYPYLNNVQSQSPAYLQAFFEVTEAALQNPFFSHLPRWNLTSKLKLFYSDAVRATVERANPYEEIKSYLPADYFRWDRFSQAQYLETAFLLPGYILASQGDRVAMANSIEGRFPFLDYRLAEFAAKIPIKWKMKGLKEKYLLKKCVQGLVPPQIASRTKQPYRAPDIESFLDKGKHLKEYARELLDSSAIRRYGIFNPIAVKALVDKAINGRTIGAKDNMALVGILSTQLLAYQFITRFQVEN